MHGPSCMQALVLAHRARSNTIEGSRKNIEEHYDAGNAMYKLFLDETMTYSSGVHKPGESLYQVGLPCSMENGAHSFCHDPTHVAR